jgi:hypothetical protein
MRAQRSDILERIDSFVFVYSQEPRTMPKKERPAPVFYSDRVRSLPNGHMSTLSSSQEVDLSLFIERLNERLRDETDIDEKSVGSDFSRIISTIEGSRCELLCQSRILTSIVLSYFQVTIWGVPVRVEGEATMAQKVVFLKFLRARSNALRKFDVQKSIDMFISCLKVLPSSVSNNWVCESGDRAIELGRSPPGLVWHSCQYCVFEHN